MTEEQGKTTPVDSGNADTTPPEAAQTGTTPPDSGNAGMSQEAVEKAIKARLDRERKKWEAERAEAEERARMSESERLKKDLEAQAAKVREAEERAIRAERLAALKGSVADPKAALKLLEDEHLNDDGTVNVDKLLETYPFLKPAPQPETVERPRIPPANATKSPGAGDLRPEDFKGRDIAWVRENLHRLKG